MERLRHEFEAIGFYLSAHPLDAYGASLKRLDVVQFGDLPAWLDRPADHPGQARRHRGRPKQERTSARGNRFAFVQLSDASGMFEVDGVLRAAGHQPRAAGARHDACCSPSMCAAEDDGVRLTAQTIRPLDEAVAARRRRPAHLPAATRRRSPA